jgi:uncharacterized membrane protein YgdD (TMEM256/DUF423 family)
VAWLLSLAAQCINACFWKRSVGLGLAPPTCTAVFYHFIHAIALLVLALYGAANRGASWLLLASIFLFSGSLYLMALTNLRWLGAVTPLGGLCFLAGWAWLIIAPSR